LSDCVDENLCCNSTVWNDGNHKLKKGITRIRPISHIVGMEKSSLDELVIGAGMHTEPAVKTGKVVKESKDLIPGRQAGRCDLTGSDRLQE
jgi:hypothetical protein